MQSVDHTITLFLCCVFYVDDPLPGYWKYALGPLPGIVCNPQSMQSVDRTIALFLFCVFYVDDPLPGYWKYTLGPLPGIVCKPPKQPQAQMHIYSSTTWLQPPFACVFVQSNLSYPDSCYPGTYLYLAADLPYFMLTLQKLWAIQWVWPIIAYVFILYSEIWINLSYGHPLVPRRPDKRGLTVL